MFDNMKIGSRLALGFGVLRALMAALIAIALYHVAVLGASS